MALIVNGVCRYALQMQLEDRPAINILDMRIDTTGSTMSRDAAILDQAGVLINQWVTDLTGNLTDQVSLQSVSWVDLDSAGGSTGSRSSTGTVTLPVPGTQSGALAGNTAVLVTKQIEGGRDRRNGRLYQGGYGEGLTAPDNGNVITGAALAVLQSDWNDFLGNINQDDLLGTSYSSRLCVVHITARDDDGHPTAGVSSDVTGLIVQGRLATQRRRLRG